jgi:hypothetical protein
MSLATICQNVAQDLGIDEPPTPIWGSKLPSARRLIAQARRAAYWIHRKALWSNMIIEHDFSATGVSDYPLPPDFFRLVNDTVWERSRYWAMRGALSPQQWQLYKSSIYGRATMWRRFRIHVPAGEAVGAASTFSVDPPISTLDHTSKFVFEYQSLWPIQQPGGAMVADWTGDGDVCILGDGLVEHDTRWRMLRRLGLDYSEEKDEAERVIDMAVARDGGTATLNLVPAYKRDDFIGQYSLGAFPPVPAPTPAPLPAGAPLPPDIAARITPFERPEPPPGWLGQPPPLRPGPGPARLLVPVATAEEVAAELVARSSALAPSTEAPAAPAVRSGRPMQPSRTVVQVPPGMPAPSPPAPPPVPVIRIGTRPLIGGAPPQQLPPGTMGI